MIMGLTVADLMQKQMTAAEAYLIDTRRKLLPAPGKPSLPRGPRFSN
jgi:hypothetical protein